jgi:hypothetical protein
VISKVHVLKLLQIKRLQKALYGRLGRRRHAYTGGAPEASNLIWRKPDKLKVFVRIAGLQVLIGRRLV